MKTLICVLLIASLCSATEWEYELLRPASVAVEQLGTLRVAVWNDSMYAKPCYPNFIRGIVREVELPLEWVGSCSVLTYEAQTLSMPQIGDTVLIPAQGTFAIDSLRFGRPSIILREK